MFLSGFQLPPASANHIAQSPFHDINLAHQKCSDAQRELRLSHGLLQRHHCGYPGLSLSSQSYACGSHLQSS